MDGSERFKVLLVDDEENVLRSLRRLLADEDYEVITASSGMEGLEVVSANEIAVVVSDQRMPRMGGAEFLEHVKKKAPHAVRIILTGHADTSAAMDAINKGGAYLYLTKPWNGDDLILALRSAVKTYRLSKENRYLTELTHRQNEELKRWSAELEIDVQNQSIDLTRKNEELAGMHHKVEKNFRDFIITISNLIELRDRTFASHSNNVAAISLEMAQRMGLGPEEIHNIRIAAQLHDIGKMGIPDSVLLKDPGSLQSFELAEYRTHAVRGQAAVDSNDALRDAGIIIRHHHEQYNGEGFPDRLRGDEIPVGSRIIALADTYDRKLNTRPSKQALEEMGLLSRIHFDHTMFSHLVDVVKERMDLVNSANRSSEMEVHPDSLMSGMVTSRDVRSGTGVLLLPGGETLNPRKIDAILRYYKLDPPSTGVFIWS